MEVVISLIFTTFIKHEREMEVKDSLSAEGCNSTKELGRTNHPFQIESPKIRI
jgi:hypothetical protein